MSKIEPIKDHQKVYYNKKIANKYGFLASAVFNFLYCKLKSKENKDKNLIDGEYWNYCTFKQIGCELGLSKRSIRTQIDKLRSLKIIKTYNHNKIKHYKRLWFAFDDLSAINNYLNDENIHYASINDIKKYKFNQAIMLKTIKYIMSDRESEEIQISRKELAKVSGFKNESSVKRSLIMLKKLNKIDVIDSKPLIISLKTDNIEEKLSGEKVTLSGEKVTRKTEVPLVNIGQNRVRDCGNVHKVPEKKKHCSFINEINLILKLDSRLDESFARHAIKNYGFEKVKKHIEYAKDRKIRSSFGGYIRRSLERSWRIPNLRNVEFAKEYSFKYDIKVYDQYVKINNNLEIYLDMDHEQFKKEFVDKLASAFKKKVPCFKHNKRLAEELKKLNDRCVKEITDYSVTIDVKQGVFKLNLSDFDTEKQLEGLINQEVNKIDNELETMKLQSDIFTNEETIEDLLSDDMIEALAL